MSSSPLKYPDFFTSSFNISLLKERPFQNQNAYFSNLRSIEWSAMTQESDVWETETKVKVSVEGWETEISPQTPFKEKILELAKSQGLARFRVYVDGEVVSPSESPDTFQGLQSVEIKKVDEGA